MYFFLHAYDCRYNPTMNQSNCMILGARESRDHQLSRAPKIIRNLQLVFAGDDFEKRNVFRQMSKIHCFDRYLAKKNVHIKYELKRNKTIIMHRPANDGTIAVSLLENNCQKPAALFMKDRLLNV